jgi:iron complex outermembrane receptor protein
MKSSTMAAPRAARFEGDNEVLMSQEKVMKVAPSRYGSLIAGSLLAALTHVAYAQPPAASTPNTPPESNGTALEAIIVTAQKRSERLQDVPVTISALSTADLQRNNVEASRDLPSVVSGLVWSNQGAWIEPNIRGVYTNVAAIGSGSPIAIYLDGIYQPSQSGTIFDLPDVSQIEVLKGPQGTLFGRNATGGAISINTKDPSFTPTGSFDVSAGAYAGSNVQTAGHYNVRGFISGPLVRDTVAGSLSASYDTTDGYLTNDVNGDRAGKIQSSVIRGKLLFKLSDDVQIVATAFYSQHQDLTAESAVPQGGVTAAALYPGSILPSSQPWHFTYDGETPGAYQDVRGASVKATFDFAAGTLTSLTGFTNSGVRNVISIAAAYAPACVTAFVCIDGVVQPQDQAVSQEFDFASKKMGGFSYIAGVFALYDNQREHDSYNLGLFSDDTVIATHAGAIFAEGTYEVTDQFSTIAGVRVSRDSLHAEGRDYTAAFAEYADKSWDSVTPRASLVYKFNSTLNGYFTYSQGFKAGVVSGQISSPAPAPASPEKISAYEVGLKSATDRYSANLAAFYYDYKDLQVEIFNNLVTTPENAATAEIYGLDFDGAVKLTDTFELRAVSSWLPTAKYKSFPHATAFVQPLGLGGLVTDPNYDASNSRMLTTPVFTGTISGTYGRDYAWGRFEATGSIYHSGGYRWEYTDSVTTSPYSLLNANITFAPNVGRFKYTLYGKNLANKAYIQGALPTTEANVVFWSQPREVGVKVGYSF